MAELGKFHLNVELGRGATATVYKALDSLKQEHVCLKVFHPNLLKEKVGMKRIQREFQAASSLNHPNIVRSFEASWDSDPAYLVMEYVEGASLEEFQSRLPYVLPEVSALIVLEILEALEYAHEQGVIHRDLKPENVLLSNDGRVVVTDFGLAKIKDSTLATQTNAVLGSPDYMSPEQARGEKATPQSDLFSVAGLFYFLVTGTRPFTAATPVLTLREVLETTPEAPHKRNPKLSTPLTRIIQKGLQKDPAQRHASAKEFSTAIKDYLEGIGLDHQLFSLKDWMKSSSELTLLALKTISLTLTDRCEGYVQKQDWGLFLETLAHLSQTAPNNPALRRLTKEYENKKAQQQSHRRYSAVGTVLLILFTAFLVYEEFLAPKKKTVSADKFRTERREKPQDKPDANPTAAAEKEKVSLSIPEPAAPKEVATEVKKPKATKVDAPPKTRVLKKRPKRRPQSVKAPKTGSVRFKVNKGIKVYWNGRRVNPNQVLKNQRLGQHTLLLEKPGEKPIRALVEVKAGKPTDINVE